MKRLLSIVPLTLLFVALQSATAQENHNHAGTRTTSIIPLPRDLEFRLAASALPKTLQGGATVLVLEGKGYVTARQGTNPFTCMVSRRAGNFYPVCFDEEGARTILPAFADDATLRLSGMSGEEVEKKIAEGFADGKYRPPSRPGIAYMLSPATYMMNPAGKLSRTVAHTMFYAPFLTNAEIGGVTGETPFVDRPGPHGMIIVPAGQKERERMISESEALLDEVEKAIGLR